jgi:hypothetical protein
MTFLGIFVSSAGHIRPSQVKRGAVWKSMSINFSGQTSSAQSPHLSGQYRPLHGYIDL